MVDDADGVGNAAGAGRGAGADDDGSEGGGENILKRPLSSDAMPESVSCPFCDRSETEQFSAFGSAVSVGQYYCRTCRTVFEWMKWRR